MNLRESLPALAPTCVANMTSPILKSIAGNLSGLSGSSRTSPSCSGRSPEPARGPNLRPLQGS